MTLNKKLIKGMSWDELQLWCLDVGESKYRGQQLYEWMYRHGISSFGKMSNINKSFCEYLENNCILNTLTIQNFSESKVDRSIKILFSTLDGNLIETVSMIDGNRHTVCISSQAGCALDCDFCDTGKIGLKRNLSTGEIVDQLIFARGYKASFPITNVVFMGMGEPFHNYANVIAAADIFHSPKGFNLASSRITISTVGILPKIKQFILEKKKYKLAISLNAVEDISRNQIMPINKKWSISDIIKAGKEYSKIKNRQVMFEYVLLKDINDSEEDAYKLSKLLKGIPCKINLIPYNEGASVYERPSNESIAKFSEILYSNRNTYRVLVRWSKGQDINAGCGQLAAEKV